MKPSGLNFAPVQTKISATSEPVSANKSPTTKIRL